MAQSVELQIARDHDEQDSEKPLKIGGQARTTNPTAVANIDRVNAIFDDIGRQITYPYQVRDLIATARVEVTTLAEGTLLAGSSGLFHDLTQITCANNCSAAVRIAIRDSGADILTFDIPATNTITQNFSVPIPQNVVNSPWQVANTASGDVSGTTITVSAAFIKNV